MAWFDGGLVASRLPKPAGQIFRLQSMLYISYFLVIEVLWKGELAFVLFILWLCCTRDASRATKPIDIS
jgi:hypothetical protein